MCNICHAVLLHFIAIFVMPLHNDLNYNKIGLTSSHDFQDSKVICPQSASKVDYFMLRSDLKDRLEKKILVDGFPSQPSLIIGVLR